MMVSAARSLASGSLTVDDVALMARYQPRATIARSVAEHVEVGLLEVDGDHYVPSGEFRDAALFVLQLQAEEAARLWESHHDELPRLADRAAAFVEAARASTTGIPLPAFSQQVDAHGVLPVTTEAQLLGFVTELRYLRSDVHAWCLAQARLSPAEATLINALWWSNDSRPDRASVAGGLAARGLVVAADDEWTLTDEGRRARDGIELLTDEKFGGCFVAIDDRDRDAFLTALASLPGEDPRPPV